jgi:hypothetical protein
MSVDRVIIVMLRQPRSDDDPRKDPFFEFGSFGLTGCHASNLLHDEAADGARLAFAQGGPLGFRLVTLTPPVKVQAWAERREARWKPGAMPLAYAASPLLIDNAGNSDVAALPRLISGVQRETPVAQFASAFRSRKRALDPAVARQVLAAWNRATKRSQRAKAYWEALPFKPATIDLDRGATYDLFLRKGARGRRVAFVRQASRLLTGDLADTAEPHVRFAVKLAGVRVDSERRSRPPRSRAGQPEARCLKGQPGASATVASILRQWRETRRRGSSSARVRGRQS